MLIECSSYIYVKFIWMVMSDHFAWKKKEITWNLWPVLNYFTFFFVCLFWLFFSRSTVHHELHADQEKTENNLLPPGKCQTAAAVQGQHPWLQLLRVPPTMWPLQSHGVCGIQRLRFCVRRLHQTTLPSVRTVHARWRSLSFHFQGGKACQISSQQTWGCSENDG